MLLVGIDLLVCLIGLLIYIISNHPKLPAVGLHMFWCGLLAFLLTYKGA